MEINTKHIDEVTLEEWQQVCTNLKIGLAEVMEELQIQKDKIRNDKDLSEEEKFEQSFQVFILP